MSGFQPLASTDKFVLADSTRCVKNRRLGIMQNLRNTTPALGSGERIRSGYSNYTTVTAPTGKECLKVVGIQNPTQEDVHIWFASSGAYIYMNPYWIGSSKQTGNMQLNETFSPTFNSSHVSLPTASTIQVTNWSNYSSVTTANYYRGWVAKNSSSLNVFKAYFLITAFSVSANVATFTIFGAHDKIPVPTVTTDKFVFYRDFHDNLTFSPAYNNDITNPPKVTEDNSVIRISGGLSSTAGNMGLIVFPRLTRTFYADTGNFTFDGTYASERRLKPVDLLLQPDLSTQGVFTFSSLSGTNTALTANRTYYIGVAPVYDGYQIGELQRYETTGYYSGGTSGGYINSSTTTTELHAPLIYSPALINKRITGFCAYVAVDIGNTTTTGRIAPYRFVKYLPMTDPLFLKWQFVGPSAPVDNSYYVFRFNLIISGIELGDLGGTYQNDSGMPDSVTDSMYSYSIDGVIAGMRFLSNVYVTSEGKPDRQSLYTNPSGGNDTLGNSGVVAIDAFPNVEGVYKLRVEPTLGTKIQAVVPQGTDGMVVFKDRGILYGRVTMIGNLPNISWETIDKVVGMTTPNGYTIDEQEWIYFASFDSIYRYRRGQLEDLITDKDGYDWLYTYKNSISDTSRNNAVIWYLPKQKAVCFNFGLEQDATGVNGMNGYAWTYYIGYGWREVRYGEGKYYSRISGTAFKYITSLQDGSILGTTSVVADTVAQFQDNEFKDGYTVGNIAATGQKIYPYFNTGNIYMGDDKDIVFNRFVVNKTLTTASSGTLDIIPYLNGSAIRTISNNDVTNKRLSVYSMAGEPKTGQSVGLEYNTNSSGEYIADPTTNKIWQIDSIELWGDVIARNTHVGD